MTPQISGLGPGEELIDPAAAVRAARASAPRSRERKASSAGTD